MNKEDVRKEILELCSESEHGSWEFWPNESKRTIDEAKMIHEVLCDLVDNKFIVPTEYKYVEDKTYKEVKIDKDRLLNEIIQWRDWQKITSEISYWFYASEKGKEEDRQLSAEKFKNLKK